MPKDQKFPLKGHLCLHQSFPQLVAIVVLANILMYSSKDGASNLAQKSDEKFSKEVVKNNSVEIKENYVAHVICGIHIVDPVDSCNES